MGFSDTWRPQAMDKHPLSDLAALSKRLTAPTIKLLSFHAPESYCSSFRLYPILKKYCHCFEGNCSDNYWIMLARRKEEWTVKSLSKKTKVLGVFLSQELSPREFYSALFLKLWSSAVSPSTKHLLKLYDFVSEVFKDKYRLKSEELVRNLKSQGKPGNFTSLAVQILYVTCLSATGIKSTRGPLWLYISTADLLQRLYGSSDCPGNVQWCLSCSQLDKIIIALFFLY